MKSKVFIGSSKESLPIAKAMQANFDTESYDIEVTLWNQGVFKPSQLTLEALMKVLTEYDFGIFVFGLDDVTTIRGVDYQTARDNVVFELGLFIGALGRERSYIVKPRDIKDLHLPTDLLGLGTAEYNVREDKNLRAGLSTACDEIAQAIAALGPLPTRAKTAAKASNDKSDLPINNKATASSNTTAPAKHTPDDIDFVNKLGEYIRQEGRGKNQYELLIDTNDLSFNRATDFRDPRQYIGEAAREQGYEVVSIGATTIRLRRSARSLLA